MKEYEEIAKHVEKISASGDPGELKQLFSKDNAAFQSLLQSWFQPAPRPYTPPSRTYYLGEVVRYVDLPIQMHIKAIAHKELKAVKLLFSEKWEGRIEPEINLEFDTASVNVVIDELWESELTLDRDMKEECVCTSGDVWGEYRPTLDVAQLRKDADEICAQLQLRYPSTAVSYSLI